MTDSIQASGIIAPSRARTRKLGCVDDKDRKIIAELPEERQSLFFSATLPKQTVELANRLLFDPVHVQVATKPADVNRISQSVRLVQRSGKFHVLRNLLNCDSVERAIVFTRTKRGAN